MSRVISRTYQDADLANLANEYKGTKVFTLTVDTRNNPTDESDTTFVLPFEQSDSREYLMRIDWGDGDIELVGDSDVLDQEACTHTYSEANAYSIRVYSNKDVMPSFNFYDNYQDVNYNSYKLISIDTPLLKMDSINGENMFFDCNQLEDIVDTIFENNTSLTTAKGMFTDCINIASVGNIFNNCSVISTFESTFNGCLSLLKIQNNLFRSCTSAKSFKETFKGCNQLVSIPSDLFSSNIQATSFEGTFSGCKYIKSIPSQLFYKNVNVTNFKSTFNLTGITGIPENLFLYNNAVTDISFCFASCRNLNLRVPLNSNLLSPMPYITTVEGLFEGCGSITLIPSDLFKSNELITTFKNTFCGCMGITSIPSSLFTHNTVATTFEGTFSSSGITAIPTFPIFSNCANATNFVGTFSYCRSLGSVENGSAGSIFPESAEDFTSIFEGCSELASVTNFASSSNAKVFDSAFKDCSLLTDIDNTFTNVANGTSYNSTYSGCILLEEAPSNLFRACTNAKSFRETFYNCVSLIINPNIFCNEDTESTMRFKGKLVDFYKCFYRDYAYPRRVGTVPALWNYTYNTDTDTEISGEGVYNPISTNCFGGTNSGISISNYNSIPDIWGKNDILECAFEFSITTTVKDTSFVIPFPVGVVNGYEVKIEWGDGDTTTIDGSVTATTALYTHTYSNIDTYKISVSTDNIKMPKFSFADISTSKDLVVSIDSPFLNMGISSAKGLLKNCTKLTEICSDLFINNFTITSVESLCEGCTSLDTVPYDMFSMTFYLTDFTNTFKNTGLTSIPNNLFSDTDGTTFNGTFYGCTSLVDIPTLLFDGLDATNFVGTFQECINLAINNNIFSTSDKDIFADRDMNFTNFFYISTRGSLSYKGLAQDLWNYNYKSVISTGCFGGAGQDTGTAEDHKYAIYNYEEIPSTWK